MLGMAIKSGPLVMVNCDPIQSSLFFGRKKSLKVELRKLFLLSSSSSAFVVLLLIE